MHDRYVIVIDSNKKVQMLMTYARSAIEMIERRVNGKFKKIERLFVQTIDFNRLHRSP